MLEVDKNWHNIYNAFNQKIKNILQFYFKAIAMHLYILFCIFIKFLNITTNQDWGPMLVYVAQTCRKT